MKPNTLDDSLHKEICLLSKKGDQLAQEGRFEEAFSFYRNALNLVPEPVEEWEATTWILTAIGDLYFTDGRFDKAVSAFEDAVRCPSGLGNPFIHLRIGQCRYELGHKEVASDELLRAYMGAGADIFKDQDPKYFNHIQSLVSDL